MSFSLTSPVTGATVPGFTAPTYTLTVDTPPSVNAKQWAVTALGGTQANVEINTVSKPYTITVFRPAQVRALPSANPSTGVVKNIPVNTYKVITRKGANPNAFNTPLVARITTVIDIPAGTDTQEPEDLKALISLHIGALNQQSSGLADTIVSGIL